MSKFLEAGYMFIFTNNCLREITVALCEIISWFEALMCIRPNSYNVRYGNGDINISVSNKLNTEHKHHDHILISNHMCSQ